MQTGFGLYQQQTAKMVMTPGLRQAIEILQLSALELFDYISWQVSENPLLEPIETDWNTLASFSRQHTSSDVHMRRDYSPLSMLACNTLTLETYLTEQLNLSNHIPLSVRRIAKYLIGDLDDNGYLFQSTEQVAEKLRVHVTEVEQALKIVQSFEPAGIGARNLRECLLLQLEQSPVRPPLVFRLITDHLEDIAHHLAGPGRTADENG